MPTRKALEKVLFALLAGSMTSSALAQDILVPPPVYSQPPMLMPPPSAAGQPPFVAPPGTYVARDSASSSGAPPAPQQQPKVPNVAVYPHDEGNLREIQYLKKEEDQGYNISAELPGPDRMFGPRLSEMQWEEQQRQEAKRYGLTRKVTFPERGPLTQEKFQRRQWEPSVAEVTPGYVVHDRLWFSQPNFERYGWDLGALGPPVQLASFGLDMLLLPYRMFSRPLDQIDGSAGKFLPGDNVPLMLYPESFSLTGIAGMAGSYATIPFLFQ